MGSDSLVKPREPRLKVMIAGRMRAGTSWRDICILNISSRGLLLQGSAPEQRGSYVEVHRGRHVIVARVVWTSGHRFGVYTQAPLQIEQIIELPDAPADPARALADAPADRRCSRRLDDRHNRSRYASRAIEFGFLILLGASAAVILYDSTRRALANPLGQVATALEER